MTTTLTINRGTGICHLPRLFELEHGAVLEAAHVAFELTGPAAAPVVVVLGGISAGRRAGDFWPELVGPGRAIDTDRVRVLGIDFLGGPGASTNARNSGRPLPPVTTHDQARALAAVLDELRIERVRAFVGASYGGQVGLAFASQHADRLERLCVLCAAHEPWPLATAWRALQREIVRLGRAHGAPVEALVLARGLAMTTYRSGRELAERFAGPPSRGSGGYRFPVEDYLASRGRDFARRFSCDEFLLLSESIDLHRVDPARVRVPTTLVGFDTDVLVPCEQLRELAERLAGPTRLIEVATRFGHDGFLKETAALAPILAAAAAEVTT